VGGHPQKFNSIFWARPISTGGPPIGGKQSRKTNRPPPFFFVPQKVFPPSGITPNKNGFPKFGAFGGRKFKKRFGGKNPFPKKNPDPPWKNENFSCFFPGFFPLGVFLKFSQEKKLPKNIPFPPFCFLLPNPRVEISNLVRLFFFFSPQNKPGKNLKIQPKNFLAPPGVLGKPEKKEKNTFFRNEKKKGPGRGPQKNPPKQKGRKKKTPEKKIK